jgi:hypothetical protein
LISNLNYPTLSPPPLLFASAFAIAAADRSPLHHRRFAAPKTSVTVSVSTIEIKGIIPANDKAQLQRG